jgi:hypothetical protein
MVAAYIISQQKATISLTGRKLLAIIKEYVIIIKFSQ